MSHASPEAKVLPRGLYSPSCRQGQFSETSIPSLGCLCVRTGAKGRFRAREQISTRYLATRLDGYSLEEPAPPASLLQHRQGSWSPTIDRRAAGDGEGSKVRP